MKKGYKKCPFCDNEIKGKAIKCQYCREFLEIKDNEEIPEEKNEIKKNEIKKNGIKSKFWRAIIVFYFIITLPLLLFITLIYGEEISSRCYIGLPLIYIVLTDILRGGVYYIDSGKYQLGILNKIMSFFK